MWANFFDGASLHLCRGISGLIGHLPEACQVNAGRPALWATLVLAFALVVILRIVLRRRAKA